MRFDKPVVYKLSGSSIAGRQYAGVIQNYLKEVGIPVEIQTPEQNTLFDELRRGNFQICVHTVGRWQSGSHFLQGPLCDFRDSDSDAAVTQS